MTGFELVRAESENDSIWRAKKPNDQEIIDERENSIESGARWILDMLETRETYSERIPLKRDRSFDIVNDVTELPSDVAQLVRTAKSMKLTQEGLYTLTREISARHPELRFSFALDPQGQWIEYSVRKNAPIIGDAVLWESHGILQWTEPRRILSIHEDPRSKQKFAFVEGINTGIPLNELISSD